MLFLMEQLSHGATFFFYLLALVAFIIAAFFAWPTRWSLAVSIGLALWAFVLTWNELALT